MKKTYKTKNVFNCLLNAVNEDAAVTILIDVPKSFVHWNITAIEVR